MTNDDVAEKLTGILAAKAADARWDHDMSGS
jgi:hypothetical protein